MHCVSPERSWIQSELSVECVVKIGDVTETGIERDLQHLRRFQRQTCCGATQAQPTKIAVWSESRELLEDAKKVVTAEPGFAGKRAEFVV
jgi:hypothetical protein